MVKNCKNCGSENIDSAKFCEKCGAELEFSKVPETPKKSGKSNNTLIILLVVALIAIVSIVGILAVGMIQIPVGTSSSDMITHDFGGITMLVPKDSNFVQTYISPRSASVGGFVTFENKDEDSDDVYLEMQKNTTTSLKW